MTKLYAFELTLAALILAFAPEKIFGQQVQDQLNLRDVLQKRDYDTLRKFNHMRNGHACIMSIVFIILYPLGAISVHLPVNRIPFMRNTYLQKKIVAMHVPIQALATAMMIGAMALGIRIAHDLGYLVKPVPAHVIIGLLVCCIIVIVQPIMGILQHRHFKKTGGKSIFAHVHRWIGRGAIILGIINNGLGFQLAEDSGVDVPTGSYIRNFVIAGILVGIWAGLVVYDEVRAHRSTTITDGGEKGGLGVKHANGDREAIAMERTDR